MRKQLLALILLATACVPLWSQLFQDNFGTALGSISTINWPMACRGGVAGTSNTSLAPCASVSERGYSMSGFGSYITSVALTIPSTGYDLRFEYSFNYTLSFPAVEIRTGASCGTTLASSTTLTNTSGTCVPQTISLNAFAGQTIYIRFRSNTSSATFFLDEVVVDGPPASGDIRWADNFNDNDLILDYPGTTGLEACGTCGNWVLGGGSTLNLVPSSGWGGNTNETEAFPASMANVYYVRLDRNEWIESPVMDLSSRQGFKISFYAKSSSPGSGGGDNWSILDRLRLQIWNGSSWVTVTSLRDDMVGGWSGPDDYISAALPFDYYCFTAYRSASSPGNHYYTSSPNVNAAWFHSGFKFRVLFEGGVSGAPFAWVDDFTFRADDDGYSTMIPCGISFWNQPAATSYGQDPGLTGNHNAEKGVELELGGSISIPPNWLTQANDGDTVTQVFGSGESERVVFAVMSENRITAAFPLVHFYSGSMGWQSSVMSIDNTYSGPGWRYYDVEYISCDLAGGSISAPATDYRYYYSFEYGIEYMPVFYQLNTSGIETGGGVTSFAETFDAPDVVSADNCGLLPVDWLHGNGKWAAGAAEVEWWADLPPQQLHHRVERLAADGTLALLEEATGPALRHTLTDAAALLMAQPFRYRITCTSADGQTNVLNTAWLQPPSIEGWRAILAPNPVSEGELLRLHLQSAAATALGWQLWDVRGALVAKGSLAVMAGGGEHVLETPTLAPGLYQITLQGGGNQQRLACLVR